jgi:hypothetical protein
MTKKRAQRKAPPVVGARLDEKRDDEEKKDKLRVPLL